MISFTQDFKMNILQRRMFAEGDEVKTLPLYEKHASGESQVVYDEGVDPEFDSFLDKYGIDAPTYHRIHSEAGNFLIYDPGLKQFTPGIDLFAGRGVLKGLGSIFTRKAAQGTGRYAGERLPGGVAGPNRPLTEITEEVTKLSPLGKSTAISTSVLPLAASTTIEDEDAEEDQEVSLVAKPQEDVIAEELKKVEESKTQTKAAKAKADRNKIETEIKSIEDVISAIQGFDKQKSEAYQQEKARTGTRNRNIFMEEMAAALAGTTNLADGLAMGAANAAKKVGEAETAEELAYAEFLKEQEEKNKPKELKTSDINDIARDYATKSGEIEGSNILISEVSKLTGLLKNNDVAGLTGWMNRLVTKAEGFVGSDLELRNAQQVSNIGKFLEARMVQALLDEKGKTISDADRKLIKDLLGDLDSATSNRANILSKLQLIETTLRKSKTDSERYLKFYDAEYGDLIPNLSVFRKNIPESPVEKETEVQVTQEDVID
jgi:hypothetical protein